MPLPAESRRRVRFGQFELDLQTRELRNNGRTFSLQEQPFQVLALLLARPGELVTREELKERLWSADTFVDFDQSLNKAVNRLRDALGDSAAGPRWIETLAGRGYRFTASVTVEAIEQPTAPAPGKASRPIQEPSAHSGSSIPESSSPALAIAAETAKPEKDSRVRAWFASRTRRMVTLGLLFVVASLGFLQVTRSPRQATQAPPRQLTSNSSENHISGGVISPDGRYLAYTDKTGMHIKLIATGELQNVAQPEAVLSVEMTWEVVRWFPDGTRFIANSHPADQDPTDWSAQDSSIWVFSVLRGDPRKLRDDAEAFSVSPDGAWIAFGTKPARVMPLRGNLKMGGTRAYPGHFGDREIWQMAADGQQAHKLYETEEGSTIVGLHWSGDGKRTLYLKTNGSGAVIETNDLEGGLPKEVLRFPVATPLRDYLWLPDGRLIYVLDGEATNSNICNYWELPIHIGTGEILQPPRQLSNWTGACMSSTSATLDGKHFAFLKWKANTSVYVADFRNNGTQITAPRRLTLDENYNNPLTWTHDSGTVFFLSDRNGPWGIFKQAIDGDRVEMIVGGKGVTGGARITPDGSWILYQAHNWEGKPGSDSYKALKVMRIPFAGGVPQFVIAASFEGSIRCANTWGNVCVFAERSANGRQLIFTALDPMRGRGRELTRFGVLPDKLYAWDLSPDGKRLAVLQQHDWGITVLPLEGGHPRRISVRGWVVNGQQWLGGLVWWMPDQKGLLMGSPMKRGIAVVHLDLQGNATVLWGREGSPGTFAIPSPDGRHLAMEAWDVSSNLWMMDAF
ncbi:MAG TPA: winged helix-turn-helix domain-containing protein [Candidatus Angelobacter sp.]|nr:winged helix-turn-helix domain-containing protein [Candidatus Angelobacter sp.]